MDLFINFAMSTAGYFILSVFIYNIAGRKRKIPVILLSLFTAIESFQVMNTFVSGYPLDAIMLVFLLRVMPLLLAWFFFLSFTGGVHIRKIRFHQKLKSLNTDIQTKKMTETISIIIMSGSLGIGLLAYYFMEGFMVVLMIIASIVSFVLGIWMFLTQRKIVGEKIIVFVGRDKEKIYGYDIPKHKTKMTIKDFYQNSNYIVDAIGEAHLTYDDKTVEKHYLFWIATGDNIDMKGEVLDKVSALPYQTFLSHFEKYHYKKVWFTLSRMGTAELVKEKVIK
jgi:hypothetical protein